MRVPATPGSPQPAAAAQSAAVEPVAQKAAAEPAAAAPASEALQSAVMRPALAALREMPDIDQARVEALRDALARGELPFDAGKLAGLIERFHRGTSR